jgi:hypothetical protein
MDHSLFNGLLARDAGVIFALTHMINASMWASLLMMMRFFLSKEFYNTICCETFNPSQDEVLLTMSQCQPDVIYLNPEGHPHASKTFAIQRLHEDYGDGDMDFRPLLVNLPLDTDKQYIGAVTPNNDDTPDISDHGVKNLS